MNSRAPFVPTLVACLLLGACSNRASVSTQASPTAAPAAESTAAAVLHAPQRIGYIRLEHLVARDPLHTALEGLDRQILALQLELGDDAAGGDDAALAATQTRLNAQLAAAAKHAQSLLDRQGAALEREEHAAVGRLLADSHMPSASSGAELTAPIGIGGAARSDAAQYRHGVAAEESRSIHTINDNLAAHDERLLRQHADALTLAETAAALAMAHADAPERLSLQTKATDLRLSDTQRRAINGRLNDLNQKESVAATQRSAHDAADLGAFREKIHARSQAEFNRQVAAIRQAGTNQMQARDAVADAQSGAVVTVAATPAPVSIDPALRARVAQIHQQFQKRFDADSRESVAAFSRTRAQLQAQFESLARAHDAARESLRSQITQLQSERAALYSRIVDRVRGVVSAQARRDGVAVVLTDTLADAGALDLTPASADGVSRLPQ